MLRLAFAAALAVAVPAAARAELILPGHAVLLACKRGGPAVCQPLIDAAANAAVAEHMGEYCRERFKPVPDKQIADTFMLVAARTPVILDKRIQDIVAEIYSITFPCN